MKHKADRSDKAEKAPLRRWIAMFAIIFSPMILSMVFALAVTVAGAVRTYRDIGAFPGGKKKAEINGEIPSGFSEADMRAAAEAVSDYVDEMKFTLLSVEYDSHFQYIFETEYIGYPDNCRMVLHCTE